MTTLSVVIPAWNEEDGIQDIMARVLSIRPSLAAIGVQDLELIVVDDGSTDRTRELVSAAPGVRLICHERNGGYGAALKTGFAAASGEWIGFLDADGTYPPEHFPSLCGVALESEADIVIGSRMAGADSRMPAVRRLGNLIFASLVSLVSAHRISDSASGMRVFRRAILERLYPLPDGLNLTPVMSTRALHEQLHMVEVPIPYSERVGRSKLSVVRDGVRFAQSIIWTALTYNPARLLGMLGLVALALAGLIALSLIAVRLTGSTSIGSLGAFALFIGLVLGVAGISLFGLGLSFNYFVALFHKQPVRQGLIGRPGLDGWIGRRLGLFGTLALVLGLILMAISLGFALSGWSVGQLWLYYLASASLVLIGIQLIVAWIQVQVLETLKTREHLVNSDMRGPEGRAPSDS